VQRILIVRMSALGDIVHALPVLAALRDRYPAAEIDWLVDRKYAGVLDLVEGLDRRILGRPGLLQAIGSMRERAYDVAIDLQGLLKSAAMARLSGAERVIGFESGALRERGAAWFYTEFSRVPRGVHIIHKNLSVLSKLGVEASRVRFPFVIPRSDVATHVSADAATRGSGGFGLLNPGAAWPNKRWPAARFGQLAQCLRERYQLPLYVLWGHGELSLAQMVESHSAGAAVTAPETSLGDLLALCSRAALMISGDTGPLHFAAAMSTPIVGIYGPTWPERNGPWSPDDVVVSRAAQCECHHKRRCLRDGAGAPGDSRMCISDITVDEIVEAVDRRLARARERVVGSPGPTG
jgi:lipopolysaccharide heptosyltransferase I